MREKGKDEAEARRASHETDSVFGNGRLQALTSMTRFFFVVSSVVWISAKSWMKHSEWIPCGHVQIHCKYLLTKYRPDRSYVFTVLVHAWKKNTI